MGRRGQPPPSTPSRTSSSTRRGRRGLLLRTSTKAPSVLRRNSNNKGPETARTGPGLGAGRMKAGEGKGIKPVGAEARRSGKQRRRGGRSGNPQCTIRGGGREPGLHSPPTLSNPHRLHFLSRGDRAVPSSGKERGGGIFRLDHNSLPPARSCRRQQPPQLQPHKGAFLLLPLPPGRRRR